MNRSIRDRSKRLQDAARARRGMTEVQHRDWLRLRYEAFTLYGNRCQCCGRGPAQGVALEVDHIKPWSKHPALRFVLSNLQILCRDCNAGKSDRDTTDWRYKTPSAADLD